MENNTNNFLNSLDNFSEYDLAPAKAQNVTSSQRAAAVGRLLIVLLLAIVFVAAGMYVFIQVMELMEYESFEISPGMADTSPRNNRPYAHGNFEEMMGGTFTFDVPISGEHEDRIMMNRARIANMQRINQDVIGWISIYDPSGQAIIDYPIVQGTCNNFYLNHTIERRRSGLGSIFLDYRAIADPMTPQQNFVVYGHNISSIGRKFHRLLSYFDSQRFFNEHPTVTIYTEFGFFEYTVYSVYIAHYRSGHHQVRFSSPQDYLAFMRNKQTVSRWRRDGITLDYSSRMLSLITCSMGPSWERVHVSAVMTNFVLLDRPATPDADVLMAN